MTILGGGGIYESLGIRPVINAQGNATVLGGSTPPPEVQAAMDQAGDVRGSGCDIFAEIGEIFAGTKSVPKGATTVYDSIGIAIMDVAAAKLAYDLITSTQG